MKRSDLSTRYVLFVVAQVGVNAWEVLSAAVPPKVALAAIQREVDAGNLDYGVWLGRPFLTPKGRVKLAELRRPAEDAAPEGQMDFPHGGPVHSTVDADNPPASLAAGGGCMFSDMARVFVLPERTEGSRS